MLQIKTANLRFIDAELQPSNVTAWVKRAEMKHLDAGMQHETTKMQGRASCLQCGNALLQLTNAK